ncbi:MULTISPECIES: hydantoinase/oxoprolinase family protein [Oceanobacillus]|uniref:Hydantoinase/oxoprolinase family protein n=1 Tax=Oceanobacillus aidingensis TaxID=645964 RepID=A0ABV9K0T7_9BACI|nr:hydantoinase/oxoprolinase family protein [Oceanobacillus oncorhynchi]MDM8101237.1 hydantoinase/oxoprolinase family protein [Oceanobacillus oncorhynchi]UUI39501.1 hydantoinase/oxoprolinase family protein [Oceanobacillus oncorhynchi]
MGYRIGIDVGGTFTDVCIFDEQSGKILIYKLSSTNKDPSTAIIDGINTIMEENNLLKSDINYLVHGTTVGTNAAIQRTGAKTGLLTTSGFRDIVEIARQTRPSLYDLTEDKPEQLIKRRLRKEVDERILHDGSIYKKIDVEEAKKPVTELIEEGIESIAVCFLHSYINPEHEKVIKNIINETYPNVFVSISSEVLPEYREYERLSTTILNSYIGPVVSDYINRFENNLKNNGIDVNPYISQSSGGTMSTSTTKKNPVRTALSGPSAGVSGAIYVSELAGFENIITLDMGGTSTDVCLIQDLKANSATGKKVAGFPVNLPMIDIHAVGAGGGSIAWIDSGGVLKVGPHSAGAEPGPVSYGLGGEEPTVTDANILLRRLNPKEILGGKMKVDSAGAHQAVDNKLAKPLNMENNEVAQGIIKVINSNIMRAVRVVSVERGHNPRDFTLVAYGGAGPLHAVDVARELGMKTVLIPESPGILCALGLLVADLKMDYVQTKIMMADSTNLNDIQIELKKLDSKAGKWFEKENIEESHRIVNRSLNMRYKGQNYELSVQLTGELENEAQLNQIIDRFHKTHEKRYGYANYKEEVQIVNFRTVVSAEKKKVSLKKYKTDSESGKGIVDKRNVYFEECDGYVETNIYDRNLIGVGEEIQGPCIIEQLDSTIVVPPNVTAKMDEYRNIILNIGG